MRRAVFRFLAPLALLACLGPFALGQQKLDVVDLKLNSKLMGREVPYRVAVPLGYKTAGNTKRYPVVYLLHGLTGSYANWFDRSKLAEHAARYEFIIVTPNGANGWYTDSAASPKEQYESYIIKELIPEIDRSYRTNATRDGRVIAGLSMGGFGAVKFGLKYPEMFTIAGSFSGALFASSYRTAEELPGGAIRTSLVSIFGAPDSPTKKANDVFEMVRTATPDRVKAMPFIYLACGTEDFLFQNNRDFLAALTERKVRREYREAPGAHDWAYWDEQVRQFLSFTDRTIKK